MRTIHVADGGPAVAADGAVIAAVGPYDEVAAACPGARVRRWPGVLGPGRLYEGSLRALLVDTFHPDAHLPERPDDTGESARRGIHTLLAAGVTAVVDDLPGPDTLAPAVRAALTRSGLRRVPAGRAPRLEAGAPADLSVHDADGCVVTVLGGRMVHRRR
ncbi:hypothetical protein [Streptomyces sp. NPDC060194]|uniref:hypothetical protein n=1 Tax=Streptomyces sp. NPDC060194 TaxID=3347069 RepID=UPI0036698308